MRDYSQYDCDGTHYTPDKCPVSGKPVRLRLNRTRTIFYQCGCYHYKHTLNGFPEWRFMPKSECREKLETEAEPT